MRVPERPSSELGTDRPLPDLPDKGALDLDLRYYESFMLPCLENIFFEKLWELQPQFGEKIFFHHPRGYTGPSDGVFGHRIYSIGKGSRMPGKFPDGEWSPDLRYG